MMLVLLMGTGMTSCEFFNDNPVSPRLKVRASSMTVQVGASRKCNVSASTRARLLYASNNESIATVNEKGIVTGVSEGDAVITVVATNQEGSELFLDESAVISVKVVAKDAKTDEEEDEEVVPVNFTTAVDQLQIALQEGAYITFWFIHQGGLYYATFKKVGDDYVLQNDVTSTRVTDRVFTRGKGGDVGNLGIAPPVLIYGPTTGSLDFYVNESVKKDDGSTAEKAVLQTFIETQTGKIDQITESVNTRVIAVNAGVQEPVTNNMEQYIESIAVHLLSGGEDVSPEEREIFAGALNGGRLDRLMIEAPSVAANISSLQTIAQINQQVNQANGVTDVTQRADAGELIMVMHELKKMVEESRKKLIDAGEIYFLVTDLEIITKNMTLKVGESGQIEYIIGPEEADKTVEWSSDNEKVATVDKNGKVTAISEGSATITGVPRNTSKTLSDFCKCTVTGGTKPEPKAGEISFGEKTVSQTWSATASENVYQQEATVMGDAVPTYSIGDNSCGAQIDPKTGKVTFTKAGSVTVTAKVNNTDAYTYATNTASYTLTVKEPEPGGIDPHDGFGDGGDPLK